MTGYPSGWYVTIMEYVLISKERQDINDRIRAHGLDPGSFAYRLQTSESVTRYVRKPTRVFGKYVQAEALALYPKNREDQYITFERDPRGGFRSSFRPFLAGDSWVSVQTWQELMGLLDQWLERLKHEEGLQDGREELPASEGRRHDDRPGENQI